MLHNEVNIEALNKANVNKLLIDDVEKLKDSKQEINLLMNGVQ